MFLVVGGSPATISWAKFRRCVAEALSPSDEPMLFRGVSAAGFLESHPVPTGPPR